ncbi:MAG: hypothetical protein E7058_05085 [Lentisphaerae bacterium]|nr:hypothetical protein [Lentisphaerota bacterium]
MNRYAFFVGIDNYSHDITPLRCACNDAKTLYGKFCASGFESSVLMLDKDAGSPQILAELGKVCEKLHPDDLLVFYFAGHGREFNGEHYLIAKDGYADPNLYMVDSLPMSALISMTNRPGVQRLFILDCCRDNLLAGRSTMYVCDASRSISLGNAVKEQRGFIPPLILNSCSSGEKAFEDNSSRHGCFTNALLKTIADRTVKGFREFRKQLQDNMISPGVQNICWTGNVDNWDKVELFNGWGEDEELQKFSSLPKPDNYYDILFAAEENEKALKNCNLTVSPEMAKFKRQAEFARKTGDFTAETGFLRQFNELAVTAVAAEKSRLEREKKLAAQNLASQKRIEELQKMLALLDGKLPASSEKSVTDILALVNSGDQEKAAGLFPAAIAVLEKELASAKEAYKSGVFKRVDQFQHRLSAAGMVTPGQLTGLQQQLTLCDDAAMIVKLAKSIDSQIDIELQVISKVQELEQLEKSLIDHHLSASDADSQLKIRAFNAWREAKFSDAAEMMDTLIRHLKLQIDDWSKTREDIRRQIDGLKKNIRSAVTQITNCGIPLPDEYLRSKNAAATTDLHESLAMWKEASGALQRIINTDVAKLKEEIDDLNNELKDTLKTMADYEITPSEVFVKQQKLVKDATKHNDLQKTVTLLHEAKKLLRQEFNQSISYIAAQYEQISGAWENVFAQYSLPLPENYLAAKARAEQAAALADHADAARFRRTSVNNIIAAMEASRLFDPMREALRCEKELAAKKQSPADEYTTLRQQAEAAWKEADVARSIELWQKACNIITGQCNLADAGELTGSGSDFTGTLIAVTSSIFAAVIGTFLFWETDSFWITIGLSLLAWITLAALAAYTIGGAGIQLKKAPAFLTFCAFVLPLSWVFGHSLWWMGLILMIAPILSGLCMCGTDSKKMIKMSFLQLICSLMRSFSWSIFMLYNAIVIYCWCADITAVEQLHDRVCFTFVLTWFCMFLLVSMNIMVTSKKIPHALPAGIAIAVISGFLAGSEAVGICNFILWLIFYGTMRIPDRKNFTIFTPNKK